MQMGWEGSRSPLPDVQKEAPEAPDRDGSLTTVPRLTLKPSSDIKGKKKKKTGTGVDVGVYK